MPFSCLQATCVHLWRFIHQPGGHQWVLRSASAQFSMFSETRNEKILTCYIEEECARRLLSLKSHTVPKMIRMFISIILLLISENCVSGRLWSLSHKFLKLIPWIQNEGLCFGLYPVERHFFARLYTRATLCSAQPKWAPTQAATTHMMRGSTERRSLWHWSFTAFPIWAQPNCARTNFIGARPKWCTTQKSATQCRAISKARVSVFSWPSKAPPSLART